MNQLIENIKEKYKEAYKQKDKPLKIAYTARLDPMAMGIVPILFNDECKELPQLTKSNKIYEVKVVIGIKTDSDDILGLVQNVKMDNCSYGFLDGSIERKVERKIEEISSTTPFTINQEYHYYSTKQLISRRKGENIKHSHDVSLYDLKVIERNYIGVNEFINHIKEKINTIDKKKNFRQDEIIECWNILERKLERNIPYIKLQLSVSNGFFVRQFISDLSKELEIPLVCFQINRISLFSLLSSLFTQL